MGTMRSLLPLLLIASSAGIWAQGSSTAPSSPGQSSSSQVPASQSPTAPSSSSHTPSNAPPLNPEPPRSDRVNADSLDNRPGESSSKDSQIDLSPPANDDRAHPHGGEAVTDAKIAAGDSDVNEMHPWDPHRAAKDIEVGDFYFKRKNYHAAEDRYREALFYKNNDALATLRLAISLEKQDQATEAIAEFENYLKILPAGPQAEEAKKAIARLKGTLANTKSAKQ
jgi:tetratricopeptide (TPR) repeat protein